MQPGGQVVVVPRERIGDGDGAALDEFHISHWHMVVLEGENGQPFRFECLGRTRPGAAFFEVTGNDDGVIGKGVDEPVALQIDAIQINIGIQFTELPLPPGFDLLLHLRV